jgi:cystathionine beta-synthase
MKNADFRQSRVYASFRREFMIYNNILETIGNTPIVKLNKLSSGVPFPLYVKMECFNPGHSIKDRIALKMIEEAEKRGDLKPGGTIIEATSGNTGMGLALAASIKGYKAIFVMPDKMSQEKILALRAFGARVVVTPTNVEPEDPRSYYCVSRRLAKETPNSFYADQYHNQDNPLTHYESTGPEIWKQTEGKITTFICGLGTGGTATGIGKYLKEKNPNIKVIGIDPEGSVYTEYKKSGKFGPIFAYKTEGIGEDFMPSTIDFQYIDEVFQVSDKESFQMTRKLARQEGLFVGGSCGSAVAGALKWAAQQKGTDEYPLILLPDSGSRYLSKIFDDDWMRENGFLDGEEATLGDFYKQREVLTCKSDTLAKDCIATFKNQGISQMPVVHDDGKLIGLVTEVDLMDSLMSGSANLQKPIEPFIERDVPTVTLHTTISEVQKHLKSGKVPVVLETDRKVAGIVTKIDVLEYLVGDQIIL